MGLDFVAAATTEPTPFPDLCHPLPTLSLPQSLTSPGRTENVLSETLASCCQYWARWSSGQTRQKAASYVSMNDGASTRTLICANQPTVFLIIIITYYVTFHKIDHK